MTIETLFLAYMQAGSYSMIAGFFLLLAWLLLSRLQVSRSLCILAMAALLLRLLVPVSIPSPFSLFQIKLLDDEVLKAESFARSYAGDYKIALELPGDGGEFERVTGAGVPALLPTQWSAQPESFPFRAAFYYEDETGAITPAKTQLEVLVPILARVWLGGAGLMLLYTALSALLLLRKLAFAVKEEDYWLSDRITSPCVVGLLHPRIYLTFGLTEQQKQHILCHERQHIHRGDHILKALSWLTVCLHWYHAYIWMYHSVFSSLLEEACDDRTLRQLGEDEKENYADALLSVSAGKRRLPPAPVSFCESDTRSRVKAVLRWKKPLKSANVLALAVLLCAIVVLFTTPARAGAPTAEPSSVQSYLTELTGLDDTYVFSIYELASGGAPEAEGYFLVGAVSGDGQDLIRALLRSSSKTGVCSNVDTVIIPGVGGGSCIATDQITFGGDACYIVLSCNPDLYEIALNVDGRSYLDYPRYPYSMSVFRTDAAGTPQWDFTALDGRPIELK